jgi:hypothetical protein
MINNRVAFMVAAALGLACIALTIGVVAVVI